MIDLACDGSAGVLQKLPYQGKTLRVLWQDDKSWYSHRDMCTILGRKPGGGMRDIHVDPGDKRKTVVTTCGCPRSLIFLNRQGAADWLSGLRWEGASDLRDFLLEADIAPAPEPEPEVVETAIPADEAAMPEHEEESAAHIPEPEVYEDDAAVPALPQITYFGDCEIRMLMRNGEPWWVLADVCKALALAEPHRVASRLDSDERDRTPLTVAGGVRGMIVVNEPGLYSLIIRSNKPEAREFKRWITHEILPQIRRTGSYTAPHAAAAQSTPFADQQVVLDLLRDVGGMVKECTQLLTDCRMQNEAIAALRQQVEEDHASADARLSGLEYQANMQGEACERMRGEFEGKLEQMKLEYAAPAVLEEASQDTLPEGAATVSVIARKYGWSATRLNQILASLKVQYKKGESWFLYQKYARAGLTAYKRYAAVEGVPPHPPLMVWTPKGERFIDNLLRQHGYVSSDRQMEFGGIGFGEAAADPNLPF